MNKFFAVALAATTLLASCQKEQGENPANGGGAMLKLQIAGTTTETRVALDNKAEDTENVGTAIYDATVFILNETGSVITKKYFSNSNLGQALDPGITTTTAAKKVIVVANTGDQMSDKFASVPTLTELKKVTFSLAEAVQLQATGTTTDANNKILLQGQTETDLVFNADNEAEAEVLVFPVPSRMNVQVLNRMHKNGTALTNNNTEFAKYITISNVAVLYSAANTYAVPTVSGTATGDNVFKNYSYKVAVPTPWTAAYYVSGYDASLDTDEWSMLKDAEDNNQNSLFAGSAPNILLRAWESANAAGPGSGETFNNTYDFYGTFYGLQGVYNAGTKAVYPTIVVIGTYDADGEGAGEAIPYFWPIKMNSTDAKVEMEPGREYDITLTMKGDITNGGGGTPDPDDEIVEGTVLVTATPKNWQTVDPIVKVFE